ncbi:DUF397 domain-containing protein [Streptomyces sp. NPDC056987]|uniref:DUF397 domain-containing protein n=1 Tax=Streptomyces sp. NPDC056987 TaxID=3345988 RepID=UPI00363B66AE
MSHYDWQKSSYSGTAGNCVNVAAADDGTVKLRESDEPGTIVTATPKNLSVFIRGVKAGQFDHFVSQS